MIRSRASREKALSILQMYGIKEPPIDVHRIAKLLGIDVERFNFPKSVPATSQTAGSGKQIIGVNENDPEYRQRFSIAHELGHYLNGHENYTHERVVTDPAKRYLDPHFRQEEEADEFAAELLMPEFMLKQDAMVKHMDIPDLAKRFSVSEQAMTIQLINHKLVAGQGRY